MLKLVNLRVALDDDRNLAEIVAQRLKISLKDIVKLDILRKSLDARRKDKIGFVYNICLEVLAKEKVLAKSCKNPDLSVWQKDPMPEVVYGKKNFNGKIVIVGAGPSGLVCALTLAKHGYKPLLLERGKAVDERVKDLALFWQSGILNEDSNIQFGEGGAGTFSDGKLTYRVNDPVSKQILQWFVAAGAPEDILYEHKPHIGTDILRTMVKNISTEIVANKGEIKYSSLVEDLTIENCSINSVQLKNKQKLDCEVLVLAIGHSARDTYKMLYKKGLSLEAKPFSIGVRIEHPQEYIDRAQYGALAGHSKLSPADYALVCHDKKSGHSAYSFCMCPGGVVVASASCKGEVATNGMSTRKRNSGVANAALVVGVSPNDYGNHPLAGMEFQQVWEKLAFSKAGSNYCAPAQTVGSFLASDKPVLGSLLKASYRPGVVPVDLREVLPSFVTDTLKNGLVYFGRKIKDFDHKDALLTGVETRTSAPIRILRSKENKEAVGIKGIYPVGEGAGYAGGIMSAAVDGYYTALEIMKEYKQPI